MSVFLHLFLPGFLASQIFLCQKETEKLRRGNLLLSRDDLLMHSDFSKEQNGSALSKCLIHCKIEFFFSSIKREVLLQREILFLLILYPNN